MACGHRNNNFVDSGLAGRILLVGTRTKTSRPVLEKANIAKEARSVMGVLALLTLVTLVP